MCYSEIQTIIERETNYNSIVIYSKRIIAKEESLVTMNEKDTDKYCCSGKLGPLDNNQAWRMRNKGELNASLLSLTS